MAEVGISARLSLFWKTAVCKKGGNMAQRVTGINVRRRRAATKKQREEEARKCSKNSRERHVSKCSYSSGWRKNGKRKKEEAERVINTNFQGKSPGRNCNITLFSILQHKWQRAPSEMWQCNTEPSWVLLQIPELPTPFALCYPPDLVHKGAFWSLIQGLFLHTLCDPEKLGYEFGMSILNYPFWSSV